MTHVAKIRTATNDRAHVSGHRRPSSLRRLRKRYRRQLAAEATAASPLLGGWGKGSDLRPGDLLLIRKAIREGWDTPQAVRDAIVRDVVMRALDVRRPRLTLAVIRCAIDMVKSNRGGFDRHPSRRAAQ